MPSPNGAPGGNTAPGLTGTPVTLTWQDEPYQFRPRASDPDGDRLVFVIKNAPSWASFDAATGELRGTPTLADVGVHSGIRIGVSDGSTSVWLPAFAITVDPISDGTLALRWSPPTENTDDSPLENLIGFKIYWGTDRNDLTSTVVIGDAGTTEYVFTNLPRGKYHFVTTAVNSFGIESGISDLATVLVR